MKLHALNALRRLTTVGGAAFLIMTGLTSNSALADQDPESDLSTRLCLLESLVGEASQACIDRNQIKRPWIFEKLATLYRSVKPFYNYDVAKAAGWNTTISECVESPAGGMGYHVANPEQLASGELTLLRPQVLVYSPMKDGSMQFNAVEYIVPADLWDGDDAPRFLGQKLKFNPNIPPNGIWALHVWVGTENPDGVFADFNPRVNCKYASN